MLLLCAVLSVCRSHTRSLQVILAVTICTRAGKLVMSRQFVEMTRIRIEGLVAAFPKLLGGAGKQHTFVETENVR